MRFRRLAWLLAFTTLPATASRFPTDAALERLLPVLVAPAPESTVLVREDEIARDGDVLCVAGRFIRVAKPEKDGATDVFLTTPGMVIRSGHATYFDRFFAGMPEKERKAMLEELPCTTSPDVLLASLGRLKSERWDGAVGLVAAREKAPGQCETPRLRGYARIANAVIAVTVPFPECPAGPCAGARACARKQADDFRKALALRLRAGHAIDALEIAVPGDADARRREWVEGQLERWRREGPLDTRDRPDGLRLEPIFAGATAAHPRGTVVELGLVAGATLVRFGGFAEMAFFFSPGKETPDRAPSAEEVRRIALTAAKGYGGALAAATAAAGENAKLREAAWVALSGKPDEWWLTFASPPAGTRVRVKVSSDGKVTGREALPASP